MNATTLCFLVSLPFLFPRALHPQEGEQKLTAGSPGRTERCRAVTFSPGESIPLALPLSDAVRHLAVVVSFPEPVTRALVPWNEEDLSIDVDGNEVMLKLLRPVEGDLAFRGRSGTLYRFTVRQTDPDASDTYVKIERNESKPTAPPPPSAKSGAIDLIRAMRLGTALPDAQIASGGNAILHETGNIRIRSRLIYTTEHQRGYVLDLSNSAKEHSYRIELSSFVSPKLLLAGARDLVVPAGGSTTLYLVFWN